MIDERCPRLAAREARKPGAAESLRDGRRPCFLQELGGCDVAVVPRAFGQAERLLDTRGAQVRIEHILAQRRIVVGYDSGVRGCIRGAKLFSHRGIALFNGGLRRCRRPRERVAHEDRENREQFHRRRIHRAAAAPARWRGMATARVCYDGSCCLSMACPSSRPRRLACCSVSRRFRSTRARSPTRRSSDVSRGRGMAAE